MTHEPTSRLDREVVEFLSEVPAGARDVTDRLLADAASGPGEYSRRVATAKSARELTPTLAQLLAKIRGRSDRTLGRISKVLAYSRALPSGKRDHANFIRLVRGGYIRVLEIPGPPPEGSAARRDSPYGLDGYYLLQVD